MNVSIAITPKYVHITHYTNSGRPGYTKSFLNDKISQFSRNRVYTFAHKYVTRATVNKSGIIQYFIEGQFLADGTWQSQVERDSENQIAYQRISGE